MRRANRAAAGLALLFLLAAAAAGVSVGGSPALAAGTYPYHGNRDSRIYHNDSCRYFWCKACTVMFRTAKEARAAGFRACRLCRG